ncbi:SpoIIE family protein phosphatase [Chitinimonas sp. PSY-7]|uniref:SpoIIE family protein phosphatase n=1 Tax=Chitinimonas sp. PSY-7 TaxID=3459088 RepID=UPI00403FD5C5
MANKLTILVVDDVAMNRQLLARLIGHLGHEVSMAVNGREAVDACRVSMPDIILMDVMMPEMDGLDATREIRQLPSNRWVPIIFVTAVHEREELLRAFEAGADDYLTKPLDVTLLSAKIKVLGRIVEMQQHIAKDTAALHAYYHKNEEEQILAHHVLGQMTTLNNAAHSDIPYQTHPAVNFSGDVISVARTPTGKDHILLADSTGHGLAAAISCLPVVTAFRTMTARGFNIPAIVREINYKLHEVLPVGRFVAAVMAEIDYQESLISIWNGGIPFATYVDDAGRLVRQFDSKYPPLGILSNDACETVLEHFRWTVPGHLVICSDGLTEATNAEGEAFGEERLLKAIARSNKADIPSSVMEAVESHLAGAECHDDLSLLAAPCVQHELETAPREPITPVHLNLADWEIKMTFHAAQIREDACMPVLLGWLNQIALNEKQFSEVLLMLSELLNNALDHGLLRLDSREKNVQDGFDHYIALRQERLTKLQSGKIEVGMSSSTVQGKRKLILWLEDSGPGFNHADILNAEISGDGEQTFGRGIALIKTLCEKIEYSGKGNRVVVTVDLQD